MDKSDGWSVNNKDDILLVAQAAAESTEAVPARAEPAPVAEPDSDSDSSSSSSSSDEDDDDDELFFQPRIRTRPDGAEPKSADAATTEDKGNNGDEDDENEDDDDDDEDEEDSSKTRQTVVKTKNEIARNELPEPEPWPDTVDAGEAVVPVGTLCHCIDDIVTVQAFAPTGEGSSESAGAAGAAADAETRPVDEGSLLCFEDRVVLGRVDEVFGQVSQPCYAVRFGRTRRPDPVRCKPGTKVFVATQHTTFVPVEQLMLQRGSDASNIFDEEPAPEELDYSDDEEEARAHTLLKQQRLAKRARMTVEEFQEQLQRDKARRAQQQERSTARPYPRAQPPPQQQQQWRNAPPQPQPQPLVYNPMPVAQPPQPQPQPAVMPYPMPYGGMVPQYCVAPPGMPPPPMGQMMVVMMPAGAQLPPGAVFLPPQQQPQQPQQPQMPYMYSYVSAPAPPPSAAAAPQPQPPSGSNM